MDDRPACVVRSGDNGPARDDKSQCRLSSLNAHLKYATLAGEAYRLVETTTKTGDPGQFEQAQSLIRQMQDRFRVEREAAGPCCDIDIAPDILDKVLAPARSALKAYGVDHPASQGATGRR